MYIDDYSQDELVLPDFDEINDLKLFDSDFAVDGSLTGLDDLSVSFN